MTFRDDRDHDDTRTVQRERVVERPAYDRGPTGEQVNVNASGGGYVARSYGPSPLYYARRVVVLLFGILQVLLVLRIILLALGANAGNALVDFIYGVTEPFVAPFRGIFSFDQVSPGGFSVLDVAAIVALIGWFLIEMLILAILSIADRDRTAAV